MADSSVSFFCASDISLVSTVASSFPTIGFDTPDYRLDSEYHSYLLCLASSRIGSPLVSPWVDFGAGIWVRRSGSRGYRVAP